MHLVPSKCPICQGEIKVRQIACEQCGTQIQGEFQTCRFCKLDAEQMHFLEVFLRSRGVLRDMERELGISYPTVRTRLDSLLNALGFTPTADHDEMAAKRSEVAKEALEQLERNEISFEEVKRRLSSIR